MRLAQIVSARGSKAEPSEEDEAAEEMMLVGRGMMAQGCR